MGEIIFNLAMALIINICLVPLIHDDELRAFFYIMAFILQLLSVYSGIAKKFGFTFGEVKNDD